jgi:DNA-binding GntR family transcriptional regulator
MNTQSAPQAETISGRIFDRLREDLLSGRFQAGKKLAISSLQTTYQVGLSPLREALNRLAATGLLEQENQRGFRVPSLSRTELDDIVQLRIELEGMAISRALQHGDAEWESELLAAGHRLKLASQADTPLQQWEQLHSRFHAALLSSCRSAWMVRFIHQLHEQFDRYRRKSPRNPGIRDILNTQHEQLVELALARNEADTRELLRAHILLSYEAAQASCS